MIKTYLMFSALFLLTRLGGMHLQPVFYNSAVTLNGQPVETSVDYGRPGVLAMKQGDPRLPTYNTPMPFRVALRRNGAIVKQWPADGQSATTLELDELWPFARFGDELVVEPAVPAAEDTEQPAKPVIRIKAVNWFAFRSKGNGC